MVLPWVLVLHPLIDKGESLEPGTLQAGRVKAVAIRFDLAFDLASDLVFHLVFHLVYVLVFVSLSPHCQRVPSKTGFVDIIIITSATYGGDDLIVAATYNVLYNAFATLVDVFLFYAHEHQQVLDLSAQQRVRKKVVEEELEVAHKEKIITHLGFAKFDRACGLTGPGCSLFEVQRVSVNPARLWCG